MTNTPNWGSGALEHDFYVVMLDPNNLTTERGQLKNVNKSGSFNLKYYGDTRAGLTLTTTVTTGESDGWDNTSALRLIHKVGNWEEILFTGYVTSVSYVDESGMRTTSYELNSVLYALDVEYVGNPYTVGKNAKAHTVLAAIFDGNNKPYIILPDAPDYTFGSATVYSTDKTLLNVVYDLTDKATNRLDVAADGTIQVQKYLSAKNRPVTLYLDTASSRAVTIAPYSYSDNRLEKPTRAIVSAKKDEKEIVGIASVGADSEFAKSRRGYSVDKYYTLTDMDPFTQDRANTVAKSRLKTSSEITATVEISTMYMPMATGIIIALKHNGETNNYMVSTASLDLNTWLWKLTLKKVDNG